MRAKSRSSSTTAPVVRGGAFALTKSSTSARLATPSSSRISSSLGLGQGVGLMHSVGEILFGIMKKKSNLLIYFQKIQ